MSRVGQGNKQPWKELVMMSCCYKECEIAGSAEILSPVNIYSYEITLSGKKEKKSHNKETFNMC